MVTSPNHIAIPGARKAIRRAIGTPALSYLVGHSLSQHLAHDLAAHVGQAVIAAGVPVRQALVVEAEQVQHGGMEVVDVDALRDGPEAEVVCGAVDITALDAAAGQPDAEAPMIMIPPK